MSLRKIDASILRLATPAIVSNITVPLLGLADLAIAGHICSAAPASPPAAASSSLAGDVAGSEAYIAAVSVGTMVFNLMYWLMGFLRMGTSGLTSQAFGAGDAATVRLMLRRSLLLAVAIAAVLLAAQWPLRETALWLVHPSPGVRGLAATYFDVLVWGAPATLMLYSLIGWFVGMQDTRPPMLVALFQNVANVAVSVTLVFGLGLRIEGIALGTLVAQWGGVALALFFARRKLRRLPVASPAASPAAGSVPAGNGAGSAAPAAPPTWGRFFATDRDIFLRTLCLVSVSLAFTSAGARQGDLTLAANTLLLTFYTLFSYVMDGFAFAGEALAGRRYGAGDWAGVREVAGALLRRWGLALAAGFTALYACGGWLLLRLLTDEAAVVEAAGAYAPWTWLVPLAGFAAFVYDGVFIGLTATRGMLLSSFAAAALFFAVVAVAWLAPEEASAAAAAAQPSVANHLLWLAFVAYLAARGLVLHLLFRRRSSGS